jgi:hypothetical protein
LEEEGKFKRLGEQEFISFNGKTTALGRFYKSPMKVKAFQNMQEQKNVCTERDTRMFSEKM